MKIISKYKDYYDYLVSKYGIDNKIILDRRDGFVLKNIRPIEKGSYRVYNLHICGVQYDVVVSSKKEWFVTEEEKRALELRIRKAKGIKNQYWGWGRDNDTKFYVEHDLVEILPTPSEKNDRYNCPVILGARTGSGDEYPRLKDFKMTRILPPDEIYQKINAWLSERNEKKIVDNRTDIEKVQSAGFDKITSFRNM